MTFSSQHKHLSFAQQRSQLPIWQHRKDLLYAIEHFSVIILVGETGTGKSTQIPQILKSFGWTSNGKRILCTQPRRIAAMSLATRVAEEMQSLVGTDVGYHVRFDAKYSNDTCILYVTDGILLRETLSDPMLLRYSVIVVDDAHERSLNSDILLGLLKKVLRKRPALRIVVTSATLQANVLKTFFESNLTPSPDGEVQGRDTACILSIQGRQHPVDIQYVIAPVFNFMESAVDTAIRIHSSETGKGDILVFMPGSEECDGCMRLLEEKYSGADLVALSLYSTLPHHVQSRVFDVSAAHRGIRRVIFATNIAESSVTIPGVGFVVDSALVKLKYFDVSSGIDSLITCPSSRASAKQRAGRAGRTQPGKCFRLVTEADFFAVRPPSLESHESHGSGTAKGEWVPISTPPEMQRVDISMAVLQLKAIGVDNVLHFDFISPPTPAQLIFALELLYSLGALDLSTGNLTLCGRNMAEIGLEPKLSKCLLAAHYEYGCGEQMLDVLCMCAVDYPFLQLHHGRSAASKLQIQEAVNEFVSLDGDHITLMGIFKRYKEVLSSSGKRGGGGAASEWCQSNSLQPRVMQRAAEIREQLRSVLRGIVKKNLKDAPLNDGAGACAGAGAGAAATVESTADQFYRRDVPFDCSCGDDTVAVRKCLLSGYFASVAKLNSSGTYTSLRSTISSGGRGSSGDITCLAPHSQSVFASYGRPPEWVMYNEVTYTTGSFTRNSSGASGSTRECGGNSSGLTAYMRDMSRIDPKWIVEVAQHYYNYTI